MKDSLYKRLMSYVDEGYVPMHMPGAKRKQNCKNSKNVKNNRGGNNKRRKSR